MEQDRHDCGNPMCAEYRKQMILDAMSIVMNECFAAIEYGEMMDPLDMIASRLMALRSNMVEGETIAQAQAERIGKTLH
jgi:hypothetical protein